MKIKTQVSISIIIFFIMAVLIIFLVYSGNSQLQEIQKKQQIIDNIETSSYELYYLENDYIIHGGTIPAIRWNTEYNELTRYLQALTLTDPSQRAVLNQMFNSQNELNKSFSNLVAVNNRGQGTGPGGVNQELKEFSASTLEGQTQIFMSRLSELSQLVKNEAIAVEQRTVLIISLSIAVLMLFVLLNYLVINRSVLRSISALSKGTERIGTGDLGTKIETISNDELGNLSHEFNEMTASLNTAQTLLLTSNIELQRKNQEFVAAIEKLAAAEKELKSQFDALAESEEKFRGIFDHINDGLHIHEIGPDGKPGKFIEVNEVACRMLQYTREEMLKHSPLDFATDYHSKPRDQIFLENSTTGHTIFETGHRRKDGTIIPVEINTHVVNLQGKRVIVAVVRDITERRLTNDTLQRVNQKLNVLSQLTRNDLTNQIFILSSYLELVIKQLAGQDRIIETVQKGVRVIQSIHETIQYSKDFQDMGAKPPKWQNLKMALLMGLSHLSIGKIQHNLETENLEIFADPLLEKVCQRLFENSVKHGEHVTQIWVWHTATPDEVTIFFEDDGIGISAESKEQIFLRGGVTGRASMRSLIFVREILDITGITIRETGEPGKGARFEMTVPKGAWRMTGNGA